MVPDVNQILVKGKGVFVNPEVRLLLPLPLIFHTCACFTLLLST